MENTAKERLILYLKEKGIGQNRFESIAGISNGYIHNLKSTPGSSHLLKILNAAPDLNKTWLLTGEGEMLIPQKEEMNDNIDFLKEENKRLHEENIKLRAENNILREVAGLNKREQKSVG